MISNRKLVQLLKKVGWINVIVNETNVFSNLVKVFYSNMDTYAMKEIMSLLRLG